MMLIIRSVIVLMLVCVAPAVSALTLEGHAYAVDGDTLVLGGQSVRLFGIDAPELHQTCDHGGQIWGCGIWAKSRLAEALNHAAVTCQVQDRDRYGRAVAVCQADGHDIGQSLVQQGAAHAYLRYSDRYALTAAGAARALRGVWSGAFVEPEAFRRAGSPAVEGCKIKGNISARGRIYHRPGQRDYGATRISASRGEAWFCSEAAAKAAGFRPARR